MLLYFIREPKALGFFEKNRLYLYDYVLLIKMKNKFNNAIMRNSNKNKNFSVTFRFHLNNKVKIPNYVKYLKFNYSFNQKIIVPQCVTYLQCGINFNKKIKIPQEVTHLKFESTSEVKIIIPSNVIYLSLGFLCKKIHIPFNVIYLNIYYESKTFGYIVDYIKNFNCIFKPIKNSKKYVSNHVRHKFIRIKNNLSK